MQSTRRISVGLFALASLLAGVASCAAPTPESHEEEQVGVAEQAITGAVGDWSGMTAGQCVHGVYSFYQARFGISLPGACAAGHDIGICRNCGACDIWQSDAVHPPASLFNQYAWGTTMPQLYDIVVFPPSGNVYGYGHVAGVDHMNGSNPADSNAMYVVDSNWYGDERVCTSVHTVNRVPYGIFRLKSLDNPAPRGYLDAADCGVIGGWAQDPSAKDTPINVDLYFGGAAGDPKAVGMRTLADIARPDLCTAIGSCNHGFSIPPPRGARDSVEHQVFAYGIDTAGGNNPLLGSAPKSFTCAPPAMPKKVEKRVIGNPDILGAWKFSTFVDMATYTDADIAKVPAGGDLPAAPTLIQGPDGAIEVIDGNERRHVVDMDSFGAWRFSTDALKAVDKAEFDSYPEGLDWPATPLLVKSNDKDTVYVLDARVPSESDGSGGGGSTRPPHHGNGGGGARPGDPTSDGDAASGAADQGGCSFGSNERGGGAFALTALLGLALAARRRRS